MKQVSVILPNFNRGDALPNTLMALANQTISPDIFEVIVVDDGSIDRSIEIIQNIKLPYSLHLLQQANQGPAAARNRGAQIARADLLVFLDSDMIAVPQLLERYFELHHQHPQAIIIGRQVPWPEAYTLRYAKIFYTSLAADLGPMGGQVAFHAMTSAIFSIDKQSFETIGGFDENLRMMEDVDLAYRADKAGINIFYDPIVKAFHSHPKTPDQIFKQIQNGAWWTAHLYHKTPSISGQIPVYKVIEPIQWDKDQFELILHKVLIRIYGTRFCLAFLKAAIISLDRISANTRLIRYLRFKAEAGYRSIGFRKFIINAKRSPL